MAQITCALTPGHPAQPQQPSLLYPMHSDITTFYACMSAHGRCFIHRPSPFVATQVASHHQATGCLKASAACTLWSAAPCPDVQFTECFLQDLYSCWDQSSHLHNRVGTCAQPALTLMPGQARALPPSTPTLIIPASVCSATAWPYPPGWALTCVRARRLSHGPAPAPPPGAPAQPSAAPALLQRYPGCISATLAAPACTPRASAWSAAAWPPRQPGWASTYM